MSVRGNSSGRRRYSGRFVLRIPPSLHERLASEAADAGLSLNEHCARKLSGEGAAERYSRLGLSREFLDGVVLAFPEPPLAIALFGSVARGDATVESDIDLLVVFDRNVRLTRSLYRRFDERVDLSSFARPVSPHLVTLPRSDEDCGGIWLEVALDGVVLWESGLAVSSLLSRLRAGVCAGEYLRRLAHGHPYWVRRGPEP